MTIKNVVIDLIESGYTEAQLAVLVGSSQPAISRIRSGEVTNPKLIMGNELLILHKKHCRGKKRPFNVRACE